MTERFAGSSLVLVTAGRVLSELQNAPAPQARAAHQPKPTQR